MAAALTFFSYSRTDSDFVLKLAKDLRTAGATLWLDQLDIKAGSRWDSSIEAALNASTGLIVVLSPASIASNNVMDEVSYALENNKTVIPVLLKDCTTPFRLRRLQRIDFTKDYPAAFNQLLEALGQPAGDTQDSNEKEHIPDHGEKQKAEDEQLWEEARQSNTLYSYKKYITESALGQHTNEAKKIIGQIELAEKNKQSDKALWEKVRKENQPGSYHHYLKEYPRGIFKENALASIERLKQEQAESPDLTRLPVGAPPKTINYRKILLFGGLIAVAGLAIWLIIGAGSGKSGSSNDMESTTVTIDDSINNKDNKPFTGHTKAICSIAFTPDGEKILTGSWDSTARLWDSKGNSLKIFKGHKGRINSAAFSPDGKTIVTGSFDSTARIWDLQGNTLHELKTLSGVWSVAYSPDGKKILTGCGDSKVKLWDADGNLINEFSNADAPVLSLAFSPDGRIIAASFGSRAQLWDLQGNTITQFNGHSGIITSIVFSPEGKKILTASWDSTARLWDLSGKLLQVYKHHKEEVTCAVFSPNGDKIATGSMDESVIICELNGKVNWLLDHDMAIVRSVAFTPNGEEIAIGDHRGVIHLKPE